MTQNPFETAGLLHHSFQSQGLFFLLLLWQRSLKMCVRECGGSRRGLNLQICIPLFGNAQNKLDMPDLVRTGRNYTLKFETYAKIKPATIQLAKARKCYCELYVLIILKSKYCSSDCVVCLAPQIASSTVNRWNVAFLVQIFLRGCDICPAT